MANDWNCIIGYLCCMLPLMIILVRVVWVVTGAMYYSGCYGQEVEDRIRSLERDVELFYKKWKQLDEAEYRLDKARREINEECAKVTEQYEEIMNL